MTAAGHWRSVIDGASPLISADELVSCLNDPTVKVFDVRGTWSTPARALPGDYAEGHIDGAVFLDWTKHFNAQDVAIGLAPIADEASAHGSFAALGIDADDLVVLYDASSHMLAGRMWLAMRHWGFANVRVLNGGWPHWKARNLPMSRTTAQPGEGTFEPRLADGLKVDLGGFMTLQASACVIDARGPVSYNGTADDLRSGHIPGSINVPYSAVLDPETGLFLDPAAVHDTLDRLAPDWRSKPVIATCGSGYAATVILLALAQIGAPGTLFDGSFAVWKQDPARPVAQSSA
ncbi:sulfurtransferase [Roseobacter sinensis]|uniref:Rhodanese domain-containing protein n=1 Tax=Roseobacter sinensis TaxID=2931391 RepID=A0ABT3B9A6_9RHOB|nr:rhodanese-like domain-containing protein [Roseobacter sp. WL0113]MCV3270163.1 hypothetical protein [Roseobacter sp. WL0113]